MNQRNSRDPGSETRKRGSEVELITVKIDKPEATNLVVS
jgi:hypothetical protein